MLKFLFLFLFLFIFVSGCSSTNSNSQYNGAIKCIGYIPPKNEKPRLTTAKVNLVVAESHKLYKEKKYEQSLAVLKTAKPLTNYDQAYLDAIIGNTLLTIDKSSKIGRESLIKSINSNLISDDLTLTLMKSVGSSSKMSGEHELAIFWYNKWIELSCDSNSDIFYHLAESYYHIKDFEQALKFSKLSIETSKKSYPPQHTLVIDVYRGLNDKINAMRELEIAIELFPNERSFKDKIDLLGN
jgi:tetratricopeptide (TPR) repeat protein